MKTQRNSQPPLGTLLISSGNSDQDIVLQLNVLAETNLSIDNKIRTGKKQIEDIRNMLRRLDP